MYLLERWSIKAALFIVSAVACDSSMDWVDDDNDSSSILGVMLGILVIQRQEKSTKSRQDMESKEKLRNPDQFSHKDLL